MSLALRLAERVQVTVLAKSELPQGASLYAQGGVAAVLAAADSFEAHAHDTLAAGLCHPDTVDFVIRHGPEVIRWLIDQGVPFTQTAGGDSSSQISDIAKQFR